MSKTQIDRLGDRLRKVNPSEGDLQMLDEYRRSFSDAYRFIVTTIRAKLRLESTGRPAKSTTAIVDKLLRESIRLSQIQDIAGCRLVVSNVREQMLTVRLLQRLFRQASVIDRRQEPSHGYRAVHIIVRQGEKLVEIQVRTALQQLWAELSEKLADVFDPMIKYGGGSPDIARDQLRFSQLIQDAELIELQIYVADKVLSRVSRRSDKLSDAQRQKLEGFLKELPDWQNKLDSYKQKIRDELQVLMAALDAYRG